MKTNFLKHTFFSTSLLLSLAMTGCIDEDFGVTVQQMEHDAFVKAGVFDFATTGDVTLDLDFQKPGANNPVWIYTEYPFDEEGELKEGIEPEFAFFLSDGKYKGACHLPTAVQKVFIIPGGMGLPGMVTASVVDGALVLDNNLTRNITTNVVTDKYGKLDVLADFDKGDWASFVGTSTEKVETSYVTFNNGNQGGSHTAGSATFADGQTWSGYLKTNGGSNTTNNRRIFEITPSESGTLKVYVSNPNNEGIRTVFLSTTLGNVEDKKVELQPAGKDILTVTVTSSTTYYMWADNGMNYHAITLFSESATEKSYLTVDDYTYGYSHDLDDIVYESSTYAGETQQEYNNFYNNLYALYPWSLSGKPLVSVLSPSSFSRYNGPEYKYEFYYDENGVEQGNGFTSTNCTPTQSTIQDGTKDKVYATIGGEELCAYLPMAKNSDGSVNTTIVINDNSAGTVKLYLYSTSPIETRKFNYDGTSAEIECTSLDGVPNVYTLEHTFGETTDVHTIVRNNTANLLMVEYTTATGDVKKLTFQPTDEESGGNSDISYSGPSAIVHKTEPNMVPVPVAFEGNEYFWGAKFTSRGKAESEELSFTVPAGTKAKLTIVVGESDTNFRINDASGNTTSSTNVLTVDLDAPTEDLPCTIKRGGENKTIYYASVEYVDKYETLTQTQYVKAFTNVENETLAAVRNRLTNTLWRGSGSKANAKAQYGEHFNEMYTNADQSKNNITVTTATELFVTFQAEYNMTSANTFGYYYYDKNNAPTTPNNLKKFIVFPNCTSNVYANGRKYKYHVKEDGKTFYDYRDNNEDLVPLHAGDQVQLMYYDEITQQYTTTFPEGTVVGWFVLYNGFDAWSLNGYDNGQVRSGKVRIGYSNNDFDERVQPNTNIYYSDPLFNKDNQARCIQFTDAVTGDISLCFEDSYTDLSATSKQDHTYDDLIVTLSATHNTDINNNSGNETGKDGETYVSFRESGTYVFEDIWDGSETDFDMNDVALTYSRLYSIASKTNAIHQVTERYTVLNDGATYNDAFVIRLPYTKTQLAKISYKLTHSDGTAVTDGSGEITDFTISTAHSSWTNAHPCVELDGDYVDLVLFNDINTIEIGLMIDLEITFKADLETTSVGTAENGSVSTMTSNYTKAHYDPFLVVANYTGSDGRCEIHLPGKNTTNFGIVPGGDSNSLNNRWYIANNKFGISLESMPFALDLPVTDFKGCREGVVITSVYNQFKEWATSGGTSNTDWYKNPATGTNWEPKRDN